ncbi:phosphoribosylformylglycinamidine synthase I [Desulfobacca acetoxidans]|uniref:Phosphoribosylformylglycinamidine synthase 1 n=1 Tax=Desulfobacca acetoxidans (strain ATCC 700848 / DSM 11109 / ASRB2) TaxID=880072 RepID=F2NJP5_DESAR|nr:phosphoribosylformylglycinamidine synthase I [Desulfobacca acetoxidans]AEB09700.1 Phosphoribosylformylglycinamidine synthase 1 [Desulfobacca acetoxidans DSM 11109]
MCVIKAIVLYGYGLNCDYETKFALDQSGAEAQRVHINELISGEVRLDRYHLLALPGGFSWGDDHGAGVILGLRLKMALRPDLEAFIHAGKVILGICNGFQVLVNVGLLPGLEGGYFQRQAALIHNDCGNFRDAWVNLRVRPTRCPFFKDIEQLELPIRHGEGKFYAPDDLLAELFARKQVALQYATPQGDLAQGRFPHNPNGSLRDIAGICDATGRILGLMPHPEAFVSELQHPTWTRRKESWRRQGLPYPAPPGAGLKIFQNAVDYLKAHFL